MEAPAALQGSGRGPAQGSGLRAWSGFGIFPGNSTRLRLAPFLCRAFRRIPSALFSAFLLCLMAHPYRAFGAALQFGSGKVTAGGCAWQRGSRKSQGVRDVLGHPGRSRLAGRERLRRGRGVGGDHGGGGVRDLLGNGGHAAASGACLLWFRILQAMTGMLSRPSKRRFSGVDRVPPPVGPSRCVRGASRSLSDRSFLWLPYSRSRFRGPSEGWRESVWDRIAGFHGSPSRFPRRVSVSRTFLGGSERRRAGWPRRRGRLRAPAYRENPRRRVGLPPSFPIDVAVCTRDPQKTSST